MRSSSGEESVVKVRGNLSTNDGAIAVAWALNGHGILLRADWDVASHLRSGRLVEVLSKYRTPDADIYAVYPQRHQMSPRVRAFVDFVAAALDRSQEFQASRPANSRSGGVMRRSSSTAGLVTPK